MASLTTPDRCAMIEKQEGDKENIFGGMKFTKKTRDIGERGKRLNPADKTPRKKVIEYEF